MYGTPPPNGPPNYPPPPPPPYGYGGPPPAPGFGPPMGIGKDPVKSSANWAIGLAAVAVPLCCAPLGIVGGILGVRTIFLAKNHGVSTPARAIVAIVMAGLSILTFTGAIIKGQMDQKARNDRAKEAASAVAGKLDAAKLDSKVACSLVQKELYRGLYNGEKSIDDPKCAGAFTSTDKQASLAQVQFALTGTPHEVTACLARHSRWFVLSVVEGAGATCPVADLPPTKTNDKSSEADLVAQEDEFRKTVAEREDRATVDRYLATLTKVHDGVRGMSHDAKSCPTFDTAGGHNGRALVTAVDYQFLDEKPADRTKEDWSFLTSTKIRTVMDDKETTKARADAARAASMETGSYMVVYSADTRDWPAAAKKKGIFAKDGYYGGGFDGWLVVVDAKTGTPLCGSPFEFENSKSVRVGKYSDLTSELKKDLKSNFEDAATKKIKEMSGGKLRLGYKVLE